jgi:diadenylate cyclase
MLMNYITAIAQAIWGGSMAAFIIKLLDFFIVYFILYRFLVMVKGTRSMQILSGFFLLLVLYFVGSQLGLKTTEWLLRGIFANIFIIIIVLFHEEIRTILSGFELFDIFQGGSRKRDTVFMVDEITESLSHLASIFEGALVVISQKGNPESFVTGGVPIDARVKKELLLTIFTKKSPLHDGAVIIKDGRITLASAVLPLSTNPNIDPNFGTRHRAAYGISELVDSLVFVVSEERGQISMLNKGRITRNMSKDMLRKVLTAYLVKDKK